MEDSPEAPDNGADARKSGGAARANQVRFDTSQLKIGRAHV